MASLDRNGLDGDAIHLTAMELRSCLPPQVGASLRHANDGRPMRPFAEEEALLSPRAVARRRLHFALGRAAAHEALRELGVPPVPILKGPSGQPLWPDGIVGSITHTDRVALAVTGWKMNLDGIGVDLERIDPGLSSGAARLVCSGSELAWTRSVERENEASLRRTMLFCAKEAVFKALYPVAGVWLGFHDAELTWAEGDFEAVLCRPAGEGYPAGFHFTVHCRVLKSAILAIVSLPARSS